MRNPLMTTNFEKLIDQVFAPWGAFDLNDDRTGRGFFVPQADLEETKSHYMVTVDLPGIPKEEVKIELHDHTLTVSGERKSEIEKKEKGYRYSERSYGSFKRSFRLPDTVEAKDVEASFNNGVLEIAIAKRPEAQPQTIKIAEGRSGIFSKLIGEKNHEKVS